MSEMIENESENSLIQQQKIEKYRFHHILLQASSVEQSSVQRTNRTLVIVLITPNQ